MEGDEQMTETRTHTHKIRTRIRRYGDMCRRHKTPEQQHVEHTTFDRIVLVAIIASIAVMIWGLADPEHAEIVEMVDYAILVFFAIEVGVRVKRGGRNWYRDGWLWFDLIIILIALLPLGADAIAARVVRGARLAHFSRHLPHLRHLPALGRGVRRILK